MTTVVASGYFDPVHVGHIEYLERAKKLGDTLIVIINNDEQAILKKGRSFMNEDDRWIIISALACVDEVMMSIDKDESVCKTLKKINPDIFAKGGDRHIGNIPEKGICEKYGIKIVDQLGDKIRSSSELTKDGLREDI